MEALLKNITEYHEHSKHYPGAYADALPFLDWDNQPDPFRSWEGCSEIELPFSQKTDTPALNLFQKSDTQELNLETLGAFLELSLGLTGKKEYQGASWWLRANPSSGNLHPTEAHLILNLKQQQGLYHYQPKHHSLEVRATGELGPIFSDANIKEGFLLGLSTIIVRESWKYGVRSFRYCQLDTGHAIGCIAAVASLFGWEVKLLNLSSKTQTKLMGLDKVVWPKDEAEEAEVMLYIGPASEVKEDVLNGLTDWDLQGTPGKIAKEHLPWQPAQEASDLSQFPENWKENLNVTESRKLIVSKQFTAEEILKKRRSGQGFDLKANISKEDFFQILNNLIPSKNHALLSHLNCEAQILLFVHSVIGL
ncbi:MAG: SagB/ThcOx family dehydrogenase, partial [SAR324 cluster bacterium]|nr:SagB/ThcOx family dehydrogenase [SAR324 cluster bacterium]